MEFKYEGKSKQAGIYRIINVQNGRIYIGSTSRFEKRWKEHQVSLIKGKHSNKFLQADFNKCGSSVFLFEIVEVVDGNKEKRLEVEEHYIKQYFDSGKQCYNLCDRAISREDCKSKDPEETRKKHSEASKKMWQDPEYQQKQRDVQSVRSKKLWSNEEYRAVHEAALKSHSYKEKQSVSQKASWTSDRKKKQSIHMKGALYGLQPKTYVFINPAGETVSITNLSQYCREHPGLERSGLNMVHLGILKSYKGWTKPK